MKAFNKKEKRYLVVIFVALVIIFSLNLRISLRRGRDNMRKNDLSALQKNIDLYQNINSSFPLSTSDGRIIACKGENTYFDEKENKFINLIPCNWGVDAFTNLKVLPSDPKTKEGINYIYLSNGTRYQLYVYLEGKDEAEYNLDVIKRNLQCGVKVCNYGRGYADTPVNISIEEYEESIHPS